MRGQLLEFFLYELDMQSRVKKVFLASVARSFLSAPSFYVPDTVQRQLSWESGWKCYREYLPSCFSRCSILSTGHRLQYNEQEVSIHTVILKLIKMATSPFWMEESCCGTYFPVFTMIKKLDFLYSFLCIVIISVADIYQENAQFVVIQ